MEILTAAFGVFSFEILYSTCLHAGSLVLDEIHQINYSNKQNKKTETNLRTVPMTTTALSTLQESVGEEDAKKEVVNEEIETTEPVVTTTAIISTVKTSTTTATTTMVEIKETKDEPMSPGEEHVTEDQITSAPLIAQSLNEPLASSPPALPEPVVANRLYWEP